MLCHRGGGEQARRAVLDPGSPGGPHLPSISKAPEFSPPEMKSLGPEYSGAVHDSTPWSEILSCYQSECYHSDKEERDEKAKGLIFSDFATGQPCPQKTVEIEPDQCNSALLR